MGRSLDDRVLDIVAGRVCGDCETPIFDGYCICRRDRRLAVVDDEIATWLDGILADPANKRSVRDLALSASRAAITRARRHAALGERPVDPVDVIDDPRQDWDERLGWEQHYLPPKPAKWRPVETVEQSRYPL